MFSKSNKKLVLKSLCHLDKCVEYLDHKFVVQLGPINALSVFNYARNKFLNKRELQMKYLFIKEVLRASFVCYERKYKVFEFFICHICWCVLVFNHALLVHICLF